MNIVVLAISCMILWFNFFNAVSEFREKYRLYGKLDFEWLCIALVSGIFGLFATYIIAIVIVFGE